METTESQTHVETNRYVCGADADTIVARNLLREIAAGAAAHSNQGRMLIATLRLVAKGEGGSHKITDSRLLHDTARLFEIPTEGRDDLSIAGSLADFFAAQFAGSEAPNDILKMAPDKRQSVWHKLEIKPCGIDAAVVDLMDSTNMGVDPDYRRLIMEGLKCSIADGWGSSMIATTITDILFGSPMPTRTEDAIVGFSSEAIRRMLGGRFRGTFRPLNDAIIDGRIRGIVGIVGCSDPSAGDEHVKLATELIGNNFLVLQTGYSATACAKAGLLTPEVAIKAGDGLREFCEAIGIPPILHMGSCDGSRILLAATDVLREGGLGEDLSDLPIACISPDCMSEKAVAIGHCFVASGIDMVLGHPLCIRGCESVSRLLTEEMEGLTGGKFACEPDPEASAKLIMANIEKKRDALGINAKKERKLYDMKERRELV